MVFKVWLTNDALAAEASRYESNFVEVGGVRDFIFSSSSSGCERALVVRGSSGLDETVVGVRYQTPLCAMMKDGSPWMMDSVKENSKGNNMSDVVEVMQERVDLGNKWDECSLVKFSKALGFSTEGVEGEILQLLLKLKTRRDQGKKKGTLGLTRFDREVKKLECSINYDGVVRSLGVGRFLEWGDLDARGAARGVVVFWDNRVLELMGLEVGLFSISCRFKNVEDGFRWTFSRVYRPTLKRYREAFWEELRAIRGLWTDPWCIGGDFNMIRFPNERIRGGRVSSSMRRFSEVIDELELRDLPLQGGPFTWSGEYTVQASVRSFSHPLGRGRGEEGPVPFRFENMWLQEEGFKDLLGGWWQGLRFSGSFSFILAEKLKALKVILKSWNKEVFGKVGVNKKLALDKVDFWDNQEKGRVLSMEELEARKEAKENFEKWVLMEEISWRQKSREVNGTWLTEEQEIKGGVVGAFKNLLTDPGEWHPSMDGLAFNRIDGEEAARLEEAFIEEEVFSALSDMNGDKAPGPDGFSLSFWQFNWEFVKVEVMGFFKEFHERGRFVRSLNSTFLVLIPKKAGAEDLRDFRQISLVGGLYKLLAKVLANRLKKVMGKVVSLAQNAFVEGRQILDAALIANEAIDSMLKSKENGVLCKLDIEKAYDHLNWNFLLSVLRRMGFGERGLLQQIKGLRQGDPLSPYLFVIGMEAFSRLIHRAMRGGFLSGCKINGRRGDGTLVSHLLFADDTLVFCDSSQDQMTYLSWLLMWFEALSGLRINLDKSEILPVGRVENLELLALEIGCKVGRLPTSYLGIPLGANHKSVAVWDGVEERAISLRLEKIQRDFLWGGGALEKKPHLVKWDTVCLDKSKGGLGVRRLSILNRALLCKWNWCFANERDNLWRRVISRKFGEEEGGWYSKEVREGFGVGFWKDIRKEGALLQNRVGFSVGNGRRVKFWKDNWCGNSTLCNSFPSLYAFASYKEAWIDEMWDHSGGEEVLTLDQLKKRGRCLANRCFLCCEEEESVDHILIQCSKARVLWELLFALFGVSWVLPYLVRDTLSGWSDFNMGKKRRKVWKAAPLCIFWVVWKERNRIAFDNEELSMNRLKNSLVCNLWVWSKPVVNEGPLSLLGFFDWLGAR
ncbi:LINE-1 reverse transcriptase-like [Vitis vinifera]|uniref:LINE-1 reverse transcriptase-like n=1 Tax=Vitis vinifera TaxID=29760 RepID=A0A438I4P0_VITVI|nr:LINE-1 reverse transcriptase-like [Vitis vinifera]